MNAELIDRYRNQMKICCLQILATASVLALRDGLGRTFDSGIIARMDAIRESVGVHDTDITTWQDEENVFKETMRIALALVVEHGPEMRASK